MANNASGAITVSDANENLRLYSMLGEIGLVRHMIMAGAYVDDADDCEGNTPMIEAARCGNTEVVRELLRHRSDPSLANGMGHTPMRLAVRHGHAETVRTLVRYGSTPCKDGKGWSALVEAANYGHAEVCRVVVDEGRRMKAGPGPGMSVDCTNMIGETGLMLAAANGDVYSVRTLVELGANVDGQDMHGSTALMKGAGAGHTDVSSMLLEVGAQVDISDDAGHTAVLYASRHGHLEVVRTLIDFGGAGHVLGGKRMFEQPAWGPNALNIAATVSKDGRYLPDAGISPFLAPSRLSGPQYQMGGGPNPPMGVPGGMSFGLHESLGLHALDMRGVRTLHTRGTTGGGMSSQLSLPDINMGSTSGMAMVPARTQGQTNQQQIYGLRDNTHQSAGDDEYQLAKKRLLEGVFGAPPTIVEREKPFKAADGMSFETRQELEAYEEENLPFVCGACQNRFGDELGLKKHFRKAHKPKGFLMEEAKAGRDRGTVDQAWLDLDLGELYMEQHELRTSIERSLGDAAVDADELDNIIRQLRKCDVPAIARDRLLVALGDGDTSEEDKALLMKYCPEEVPKQKADIFDALIMYQGHLKLLYEDYAKNPGKDPSFTKERFEMMLKDMGVLGSDFKKNRSDMVFERVVQQRAQRNMDGTIKKAKTLTEPEFIHALIRLAYIKFSKLIGVHDKFIWMLKRFICAHEKCLEVDDEMPLNMDSGKVKGLISDKKRQGQLKKTFARYGEKRDGQAIMTLSQFMGMLKSANIIPNDEVLSERECRFCFLATNDDETATVEPMGGMTANSAIIVSYGGFCEVLGRLARAKHIIPMYDPEDTSKPGKLKPLAPAFEMFCDKFMANTQSLDFLALKRVGLTMKRKTAQQIRDREAEERGEDLSQKVAPILIAVKEQLGQDAADMLEAESKVRTVMFSVLANYGCDVPNREMLMNHLAGTGLDQEKLDVVEECLKEVEEGGKLKEKAKRVLVHNYIKTSPEEELAIIVQNLEAAVPKMEPVFVYYGSNSIFDRTSPMGQVDAEGVLLMLTDLAVLSEERGVEPPREYVGRQLDRLKVNRVLQPGDLPIGRKDKWEWPVLECPETLQGRERKEWQPTTGDILDFQEFKRLMIRLAYDKYKSVPGGIGIRVEKLINNSMARHWAHTLNKEHAQLQKDFKGKALKAVISTARTNLRKIYKEIGDWVPLKMDPEQTYLFLEACDLQPNFVERQRRLRYIFFSVMTHHDDKELFEIWLKCLCFLCKEQRALAEAIVNDGGEIATWPLMEPLPETKKLSMAEAMAEADEEDVKKPKELRGAPMLIEKNETPFATIFNDWMQAGVLALPWNWKDLLTKVRSKKEKRHKKELEAEAKRVAKRVAKVEQAAMEAAAGVGVDGGGQSGISGNLV